MARLTEIRRDVWHPVNRSLTHSAISAVWDLRVTGVNCMNGPHPTVHLLQRIPLDGLLAAYPNSGCPKYTDGRFIYHAAPDYFAQVARGMVAEGARLIGGCCGTNPRTVAAISKAIAGLKPVKAKAVTGTPPLDRR